MKLYKVKYKLGDERVEQFVAAYNQAAIRNDFAPNIPLEIELIDRSLTIIDL